MICLLRERERLAGAPSAASGDGALSYLWKQARPKTTRSTPAPFCGVAQPWPVATSQRREVTPKTETTWTPFSSDAAVAPRWPRVAKNASACAASTATSSAYAIPTVAPPCCIGRNALRLASIPALKTITSAASEAPIIDARANGERSPCAVKARSAQTNMPEWPTDPSRANSAPAPSFPSGPEAFLSFPSVAYSANPAVTHRMASHCASFRDRPRGPHAPRMETKSAQDEVATVNVLAPQCSKAYVKSTADDASNKTISTNVRLVTVGDRHLSPVSVACNGATSAIPTKLARTGQRSPGGAKPCLFRWSTINGCAAPVTV
mmetsp:Transcript_28786/g.97023  ORF Transcript_28786/g.97023 Transcript_28786/m.97023 type:complete len:321 (-) Transcript_28786:245-1207(-)